MIHNGFNDSVYAYCSACGLTAILSEWRMPKALDAMVLGPFRDGPIPEDVEGLLTNCPCGGTFSSRASPRCPNCQRELSATDAAIWIEANAPGSKLGWRWQRSWGGLHCIIIEDRVVFDNWKDAESNRS